MRSLLRYLINNYAFLLFLFLEIVSIVLVLNYNKYHQVQYLNSSNRISASAYNTFSSVIQYFELKRVNQELAEENARLKQYLSYAGVSGDQVDSLELDKKENDTTFNYISAKVINNSVNKIHNYITLNKGKKHGVKPDQGIISSEGIVGVVIRASDSYSVGFSVLNNRWGPSGKLKNSGFFGPVEWSGTDYQMASLNEIPFHVKLAVGDTIVTSGYSAYFPEDIMIGTIHSFEQPEGESFYDIKVKLAVDFKSIYYVDVIDNTTKEELMDIETVIEHGETIN